ncbi:phosphopantetheine-binding protein [Gimesia fumaroli]|uniref:Aminoacyl carrier protein 1 n=1 Tax=Gimesia fumaroli TaxID=2527976 RepID=A0A518IJ39_9PLAN|nr:phosphopantetheine-binding protein [Gimesia fumaroli]QDV53113.1 Aminoacyl carrier protein 1 [Gimesia fumaroli]
MDSSIQIRLIDFLRSVTGQQDITASTDLLDSGLLDSLTMMDLLVFVESEFELRLDFQDIKPELFKSPETIARLIASRLSDQGQSEAA